MFEELWQYTKWYVELIADGIVLLAIASLVLFFWWKILLILWLNHKLIAILLVLGTSWFIGRIVNALDD